MRKSKYSEEFKKVSVQRVFDGESQKIIAADLGINAKTLSQWVNHYLESKSRIYDLTSSIQYATTSIEEKSQETFEKFPRYQKFKTN